jgi:hypothetical protein
MTLLPERLRYQTLFSWKVRDIELTFSKITLYISIIFFFISGLIGLAVYGILSFLSSAACFGVFGSGLLILVSVGLYYRKNWAFYGGFFLLSIRLGYYWTATFTSELLFVFFFDALLNTFAVMFLVMSYKEFEFKPIRELPRGSDLRFQDITGVRCERCGSEKIHIPVDNVAECQSCGHEFSFKGPNGR